MNDTPPCIEIPPLPEIPEITLIGGAKLSAFADFSQGLPSKCSLSFSLLAQLAPALGSFACLLEILNVLKSLQDFVGNPLNPENAGKVLDALGGLAGCFTALTPIGLAVTIKGILELIIQFLSCLIEELEKLISFQISIETTGDNPVLDATLECAKNNAQITTEHLLGALGPLGPLFDITTSIAGIAGLPLELPDAEALKNAPDPATAITQVKQTIGLLEDAIAALPG